jgi:hypothetical protein
MKLARWGIIVAAITVGALASSGAFAATLQQYTFTGRGTAVTAAFTYDGIGNALYLDGNGVTSLAQSFAFHGVGQYNTGSTFCTVTRLDGSTEPGVNLVFVRSKTVILNNNTSAGTIFEKGWSGSGCTGSDGAFSIKETDLVTGGTGIYKNAFGSVTFSESGVTLAAPSGGAGIFNFFKANGSASITLP